MSNPPIEIQVNPIFLEDQSVEEYDFYLWTYEITIINHSDEIVQLLNRSWKITAMNQQIEEVDGPGVVGLQPVIKPGKSFVYSSFCQLQTPQGTMSGHYEFQIISSEKHFKTPIQEFSLTSPLMQKELLH